MFNKEYWNQRGVLVPFVGREVTRLLKSMCVVALWGCITIAGYLGLNPSQMPIEFRQDLAEFVSMDSVETNGVMIPTAVVKNGEEETTFKKVDGDWVNPATAPNFTEANSRLSDALDSVQRSSVVGEEVPSGTTLQGGSWVPRIKQ